MAKTWDHFMKGLAARAKAAGPVHVQTLKALRDHYRHLGHELSEERRKLGMSQEQLAAATGIDQAEISRIERDLVDPRMGTYVKLLAGMGLGLRVEPLAEGRRVAGSRSARSAGMRRR